MESLRDLALDKVTESLFQETIQIPPGIVSIKDSNIIFERIRTFKNINQKLFEEMQNLSITEMKVAMGINEMDILLLNKLTLQKLEIRIPDEIHPHILIPLCVRDPSRLRHLDLRGTTPLWPTSDWLLMLDTTYENLETLKLHNERMNRGDFSILAEKFPNLQSLSITNSVITSISDISHFNRLTDLSLHQTRINGEELGCLLDLSHLKSLDMFGQLWTRDSWNFMRIGGSFPDLEYLDVSCISIDQNIFDELMRKQPKLKQIGLLNYIEHLLVCPGVEVFGCSNLETAFRSLQNYVEREKEEIMTFLCQQIQIFMNRDRLEGQNVRLLNEIVVFLCGIVVDYHYNIELHEDAIKCLEMFRRFDKIRLLDITSDKAIIDMFVYCLDIKCGQSKFDSLMEKQWKFLNCRHFFRSIHINSLEEVLEVALKRVTQNRNSLPMNIIIKFLTEGIFNREMKEMICKNQDKVSILIWERWLCCSRREKVIFLKAMAQLTEISIDACRKLIRQRDIGHIVEFMKAELNDEGESEIIVEFLKILRNFGCHLVDDHEENILDVFYKDDSQLVFS
uniref:FTH domain-containing protein n=1 Tax=Caenorhabditis tropicalis TaxID=1561998 RepID=A0A1I7TGT7_9PELO